MYKVLWIFFSLCCGVTYGAEPGSDEWIATALTADGLELRLHGFTHDALHPVATWRSQNDFFQYRHFPLIPRSEEVVESLRSLQRHDKILVFGEIKKTASGQTHIYVRHLLNIELHGERRTKEVVDLQPPQTAFLARVHFSSERFLVLDWGGATFPVLHSFDRFFWRNDVVEVELKKQSWPASPAHFRLTAVPNVVESVENLDGMETILQGRLVRYPKSPQIRFDVYAIEWVSTVTQWPRYVTVMPENMEDFYSLREKLEAIWERSEEDSLWEGEHQVKNIKIQAKGRFHVKSPEQANVQILLETLQDLIEL